MVLCYLLQGCQLVIEPLQYTSLSTLGDCLIYKISRMHIKYFTVLNRAISQLFFAQSFSSNYLFICKGLVGLVNFSYHLWCPKSGVYIAAEALPTVLTWCCVASLALCRGYLQTGYVFLFWLDTFSWDILIILCSISTS